jgi:hypothetical protein
MDLMSNYIRVVPEPSMPKLGRNHYDIVSSRLLFIGKEPATKNRSVPKDFQISCRHLQASESLRITATCDIESDRARGGDIFQGSVLLLPVGKLRGRDCIPAFSTPARIVIPDLHKSLRLIKGEGTQ